MICYPLLNIFWIYYVFIYAFVLAGIRREFLLRVEEETINFVLLLSWKKSRFSVIFIYLAWMNFPAGPFTKITWAKCVTLIIFAKTSRKLTNISHSPSESTRKFIDALKAFFNFSFVCFHWKITWHLGKVNKKFKTWRVSNWIDAQPSCLGCASFNVPPCLLSKTTDKLLL